MSSDAFLLTAEELRVRKRKRRIWFFITIVVALVVALCLVLGKSAAHAIKAFQARRHANNAFALIEQEKWKEARDEAGAAYQLYPNEPQAIRAVARFLSRVRNPEALEFWKKLREHSPLTRQDSRDETAVALAFDEPERATAAVQPLLANNGKEATPADWLLATIWAQKKGDPQDARRFLQKVFADSRTSEREILQTALLELQIGGTSDPASRDRLTSDAWSRISKIAQGKNAESLDALVLLAQKALGGKVENRNEKEDEKSGADLARALEDHPLAKAPQKLIALDLRMAADPSQKDTCIEHAIAQWKNADAPSLIALATWLNGHREFQRELDTVPLEKAVQDHDLFLQRLDALGALSHWNDVKELLLREGFPLEPTVQNMYLARCTAQLGEKTASQNNWKRALEAAGGDAQKLLLLGDFAGKNGELDIAKTAYDSAAAQSPKLRIAQQGRLRIAQATHDTKKMHAVLAEMLKLWPNDIAIQNDEAYTRLLLLGSSASSESQSETGDRKSDGKAENVQRPTLNSQRSTTDELITIEKLATDLIRREPGSLPHRTLLALALLRQNRPVAALDVYNGINVSRNALTPSALAVHAAVLAANGQRDDARKEFAQLKFENLLPEEQAATADLKN